VQEDVEAFVLRLTEAAESIENQARAVEERIRTHATALAEQHAIQEAEYRTIIAASEEQGERAAERLGLQTALANAQSAANEQLAKEQQRQGMIKTRSELLKRASELHDQRFALRKQIAERLSGQFPSIRVTLTQAGELHNYQELVTDALKGCGVKQGVAAERLCQIFLPTELAEVVANNDLNTLTQRSGFDEDRSKKILSTLRTGGTHYAIETVALDDRPCIELLDGDTFKESTHLSTGQRCTTVLPILLTQSERPLLIDQPEDNLDNAFVYETIVRALQTIKGSRQVIFVTHNPNIPVLGEAERVFVLPRSRLMALPPDCPSSGKSSTNGSRPQSVSYFGGAGALRKLTRLPMSVGFRVGHGMPDSSARSIMRGPCRQRATLNEIVVRASLPDLSPGAFCVPSAIWPWHAAQPLWEKTS